jgi:threonine dehydrogenase-like Zn-dependent dehydrogenase
VTMGHEFCGRVIQAPADSSSNLKVGQAVMVDPRLCCGSCTNCQALNTNGCAKWGFLGLSGFGGGLSEAVAVDASMCHVLPESVPLDLAALIEPLAVAQHAAACTRVQDWSKESVLCIGGGPVAIAVAMILRARGVGKVFISEPTVRRREHAVEICHAVIDPVKEDVGERCRSLTDGAGVSVVFDCAGVQVGLEAGMDALRFGGVYVNVAGWETPVRQSLRRKGFHVADGSCSSLCHWPDSCSRRSP